MSTERDIPEHQRLKEQRLEQVRGRLDELAQASYGLTCAGVDPLSAACATVLGAIEAGLPLRHLRECVQVSDEGCSSASPYLCIVVPAPEDFDYLARTLDTLGIDRHAKDSSMSMTISLADLHGTIVPWPAREVRDAFVRALTLGKATGESELAKALGEAWALAARDATNPEDAPSVDVP